ncbi:MAG: hypothetical protein ABL921_32445 [Pirellula sp.]
MRLFMFAFGLSAVLTATSAFAGNDEPLTGGTKAPGHARFEVTPAQQYLVAKARSDAMHRQSILNHYDWMGVDYGRPLTNAGVFTLAPPPVRVRRVYLYPGQYAESFGYSYGF